MRRVHACAALVAGLLLVVVGCEKAQEHKATETVVEATRDIDSATVGRISGVVRYEGPTPKRVEQSLDSDPTCKAQHSGPVYHEAVQVSDGKLHNVYVHIAKGLEGVRLPAAPTSAVVLDQKGCLYAPHVIGVQVKQPVVFVNSDPLMHNVHTARGRNRAFNFSMPNANMRIEKVFRKAERMVHTRCDVHPWMNAYIGVSKHPFFAVTGGDGAFELSGLPPGTYTVEAWHEVYGTRSQSVTVEASGETKADFAFAAKKK